MIRFLSSSCVRLLLWMFLATLAPLSVSAENEAEKKTNEVMQLVFTYVERNGFQPRTYESEIYQRHRMYT